MRFALITVLLLATTADADHGSWQTKAAAHTALWARFVMSEPKRAIERMPNPLRYDIAIACGDLARTGMAIGPAKRALLGCLGEQFTKLKVDPSWMVTPVEKLPMKAHATFAKRFGKTTKFVLGTHAHGYVVVALGAPRPDVKRALRIPPILGVLVDEANSSG